jgi:hypothetical protein
MDWIKINRSDIPDPLFGNNERVFLWDVENNTATVGKFEIDSDYGPIVYAYGEYYFINCFSHYAFIESPIN